MDSLNLSERIDKHFPRPKSNRGCQPSEFIKTFILMQHEGSFHLDGACQLIARNMRYPKFKKVLIDEQTPTK